jgi:hypothetical protein
MKITLSFVLALILAFAGAAWAQDSLHVRRVAQMSLSGNLRNVCVQGDYSYVMALNGGLYIIDISDSTSPRLVYNYDPVAPVLGGAVRNDLIFLALDESGVQALNVADPANPHVLGILNTPGHAYSVELCSEYAYVADYNTGLHVIRISNPDTLSEVGFLDTPGYARDVAIEGDWAYLADGTQGLRVIGIADPAHPQDVGYYNTPGAATGVAVRNSLAYVADVSGGLRIISVESPSAPLPVGAFQTATAMDVALAVTDSFAFLADEASGLRVIAIADPAHPQEVGYYLTDGEALGVAARRHLVFVADDSYFGIYDVTEAVSAARERTRATPRDYAILRAYPNPFNSTTTLQLSLPRLIRGRLVVHDIAGRTVCVLADGDLMPGESEVRFDASVLASGVYFVRLECEPLAATQKIYLVR